MGLGDSISQWLDGDPGQSFFQFDFVQDDEVQNALKNVDLMCTKSYTPSGLVTISIYFEGVFYLTLLDGSGEQPLLDSKFPDVAGKGRGYQIRTYPTGVDGWKGLRKVSVWQTKEAMQKEMQCRMDKVRFFYFLLFSFFFFDRRNTLACRAKMRRGKQKASLIFHLFLKFKNKLFLFLLRECSSSKGRAFPTAAFTNLAAHRQSSPPWPLSGPLLMLCTAPTASQTMIMIRTKGLPKERKQKAWINQSAQKTRSSKTQTKKAETRGGIATHWRRRKRTRPRLLKRSPRGAGGEAQAPWSLLRQK